jgi:hypothetical protein
MDYSITGDGQSIYMVVPPQGGMPQQLFQLVVTPGQQQPQPQAGQSQPQAAQQPQPQPQQIPQSPAAVGSDVGPYMLVSHQMPVMQQAFIPQEPQQQFYLVTPPAPAPVPQPAPQPQQKIQAGGGFPVYHPFEQQQFQQLPHHHHHHGMFHHAGGAHHNMYQSQWYQQQPQRQPWEPPQSRQIPISYPAARVAINPMRQQLYPSPVVGGPGFKPASQPPPPRADVEDKGQQHQPCIGIRPIVWPAEAAASSSSGQDALPPLAKPRPRRCRLPPRPPAADKS